MSSPLPPADRPSTSDSRRARRPGDKSLGDLVSSASKDFSTLMRAEVELAKLEIKDDVRNAIAGGIMFAVAAVFGIFITFVLLIALGEGLVAAHIWRWAAYLIVAGVLALLAGIVALVGLRLVKKIKAPERTIATAKDTATWAKKPTEVPPNAPAELAQRTKSGAQDLRDRAADAADRARQATGDAATSARRTGQDVAGAVRDKAADAKDKAAEAKDGAADALDRGGRHRG